jgi:hypothetical protein
MKRSIIDFLKSDRFILTTLGIAICLFTMFYISYNQPREIDQKFNGIKYQVGNPQSAEPINIEIKGKYEKELFVKGVHFDGTIKIGDKVFPLSPTGFIEYMILDLESYGILYISDKFELLTIEVLEPTVNGGYSWSGQNGWLISAPSDNRKEAVEISNKLMQKLYKGLIIK